MLFTKEMSVCLLVSLLGKKSVLEADFMGHQDPRGKGSNMKTKAGNLIGKGTELLQKVKEETGKATVPTWGKRPQLTTHPTWYLSRGCQYCNMKLPIVG